MDLGWRGFEIYVTGSLVTITSKCDEYIIRFLISFPYGEDGGIHDTESLGLK